MELERIICRRCWRDIEVDYTQNDGTPEDEPAGVPKQDDQAQPQDRRHTAYQNEHTPEGGPPGCASKLTKSHHKTGGA